MSAQIVIDDGSGPHIGTIERNSSFVGATFTFSNFDDTGVAAWRWTLADRPIGSSAAPTSTSTSTMQVTADIAGGYLVRLETFADAERTILLDADEQLIGVAFATPYDWQVPAAGETKQRGDRGWATPVERMIRQLRTFVESGAGGVGPFVLKFIGGLACDATLLKQSLIFDQPTINTVGDIEYPVPAPFVASALACNCAFNDATTSTAVALVKNGVPTALTVTIPAGTTGVFFIGGQSVAFGTDDTFGLLLSNTGGGAGHEIDASAVLACNPLSPIDPDAADATTTTHGLMSAVDKTKLDGIESGAQAVTAAHVAAALDTDTAFNIGDGSLGSPIQIRGSTVLIQGDGSESVSISYLATPTNPTDAATKGYVDAMAQGLSIKQSVRVATTANGTLATAFANGQTVDGVVLATGDRILLKDQTTQADRGIYRVSASGAPTRTTDWDATSDLAAGAFVFVEEGTVNADSGWVLTTDGVIIIGTTAIAFTQFSGAGQITAGSGVTKTGNTLAADFGTGAGKVQQATSAALVATAATLAASLAVNSQKITGVADPTSAQDAATKSYVDHPALRDVGTGGTDTLLVADIGCGVKYSKAGAVAVTLSTLASGYVSGTLAVILIMATDAATALTITPTGAGVQINGSTSAWSPTSGPGVYSLSSYDGLKWFH